MDKAIVSARSVNSLRETSQASSSTGEYIYNKLFCNMYREEYVYI